MPGVGSRGVWSTTSGNLIDDAFVFQNENQSLRVHYGTTWDVISSCTMVHSNFTNHFASEKSILRNVRCPETKMSTITNIFSTTISQ